MGRSFLHVRRFDEAKGEIVSRGGVTLLVVENPSYAGEHIAIAAVCSPLDNYCRRTGREVALIALKHFTSTQKTRAPVRLFYTKPSRADLFGFAIEAWGSSRKRLRTRSSFLYSRDDGVVTTYRVE
jgi:hypothetical protein